MATIKINDLVEIEKNARDSFDNLSEKEKKALSISPSVSSLYSEIQSSKYISEVFPGISKVLDIKTGIEDNLFKDYREMATQYIKPFSSVMDNSFINQISEISKIKSTELSSLINPEFYQIPSSDWHTVQENCRISESAAINTLLQTEVAASKALLDTSWIMNSSPWEIEASNLINMTQSSYEEKLSCDSLLLAEQNSIKLMSSACEATRSLTSVSAQIASLTQAYSDNLNKWKNITEPLYMADEVIKLVTKQHEEMQKAGRLSTWRLGIIDIASKVLDRQTEWALEFAANFPDGINVETEDEKKYSCSLVSFLPEYLGYTNRQGVNLSPEDGFVTSVLVQITEMGKQIIEKLLSINKLCECSKRKEIFSCTNQLVAGASIISSTVCSNKEILGNVIDCFYNIFYENLEHIKLLVPESVVKNDEIYKCIFRVKNIRTDYRHDYEHGGSAHIENKRKDIEESYRHYTNRAVLTSQKDFTTLQVKLYEEFLLLEDHLIGLLQFDDGKNLNGNN